MELQKWPNAWKFLVMPIVNTVFPLFSQGLEKSFLSFLQKQLSWEFRSVFSSSQRLEAAVFGDNLLSSASKGAFFALIFLTFPLLLTVIVNYILYSGARSTFSIPPATLGLTSSHPAPYPHSQLLLIFLLDDLFYTHL